MRIRNGHENKMNVDSTRNRARGERKKEQHEEEGKHTRPNQSEINQRFSSSLTILPVPLYFPFRLNILKREREIPISKYKYTRREKKKRHTVNTGLGVCGALSLHTPPPPPHQTRIHFVVVFFCLPLSPSV